MTATPLAQSGAPVIYAVPRAKSAKHGRAILYVILSVALVYYAFKRNYRDGRLYETITLSPEALKLTRVHPSGRCEEFDFNPYWARVRCTTDRPDGRTSLRLVAQGREILFGQFLTDDERRNLADALTGALISSRTARF